MKFYVMWRFADGSFYGYEEEFENEEAEIGCWAEPFPNVSGDSFAFGMAEGFAQSDVGAMICSQHGMPVALETSTKRYLILGKDTRL